MQTPCRSSTSCAARRQTISTRLQQRRQISVASTARTALRAAPPPPQQQQQIDVCTGSTASNSVAKHRSLQQHSFAELQQRLASQPAAAAADPRLLTAAIKACSSVQQAAGLFLDHSAAFNHIHTAALISHLPKVLPPAALCRLSQQQAWDLLGLLQELAELAEEVLPACGGRELANIAAGFAGMDFHSRRLMQLLLGRCQLPGLQPQELASLAWAVAKQGHGVHEGWVAELMAVSRSFMARGVLRPRETATIAWALAVMQRRCLLAAAPPLRASCTVVDAGWKAELCRTLAAQANACNGVDVSMAVWALAVLGHHHAEQQWLDLMMGRAGQLLEAPAATGGLEGRHAAALLWAAHQLQQQQLHHQQQQEQQQEQQQQHLAWPEAPAAPTAFYVGRKGLISAGRLASGGCNNATVVSSSSSSSLHQFWGACQPKLQQLLQQQPGGAPPQQQQQQLRVSLVLLLSLSRLRVQPPAGTVQELLAPAAAGLMGFVEQKRQQLLSGSSPAATPRQRRMLQTLLGGSSSSSSSSSRWQGDLTSQRRQQQPQQQQVRLADVALLLHSLARLSYRPSDTTLAAAVAAASVCCLELLLQQQQQQSQPQQQQQQAQPAAIRGHELSVLLWALVKLRHRPPPLFLQLVTHVAAVEAVRDSFSVSELGLLFWGLARFRHEPSREAWLLPMAQQLLCRVDDCLVAGPGIAMAVWALPLMPPGCSRRWQQRRKQQLGALLPQLASAAAARLGECGPAELVQLMVGFSRLGFRPEPGWMAAHRARVLELGVGRFSGLERQVLGAAVARVMLLPSPDACYAGSCVSNDARGGGGQIDRQQQQQLEISEVLQLVGGLRG